MTADEVKKASEQRLEQLGLKISKTLPKIEPISSLKLQSAQDIARRILVLSYLIPISFNTKRRYLRESIKKYQLVDFVTPKEKKLLTKWFLTKQDRIDTSWISESIEVLGWTIGLWTTIDPLRPCDEDQQVKFIPIKSDPVEFIKSAQRIDASEIYKEADLIYRLHWKAKRETFGELKSHNKDIYSERHKAINWVISKDLDWDLVTTDT